MTTDIKATEALCEEINGFLTADPVARRFYVVNFYVVNARDYLLKSEAALRQLLKENEALKQQHAQAVEAAYKEAYEITPNHAVTATEKYFAVLSAWQSSQAKQRLEEG